MPLSRSARMRWLLLLLLLLAALLTRPWETLPPAWNPLEPLAIEHSMTPVSRWKLAALKNDPEQCLAVLAAANEDLLDYLELKDYTPIKGCPLTNVVRVRRSSVRFSSAFTVTCPLLVAWLMFEQQQLQPLALEHMGSQVSRVDHFGSFACRNIYNRDNARLSQHATANAFDVAAFRLEDGEQISVLGDWDSAQSPAKSIFLKALHKSACGYFGTVLGPDYNRPHENHFHLEASGYGFCR